jgi:diguanylate cyclase (GGDEF)-like protein
METKEPVEEIEETTDQIYYRLAHPYIATRSGDINCMQCHNVEEGTILGVVSITMNLSELRAVALKSISSVIALLVLFGGLIAYFFWRLLSPVIQTTSELKVVAGKAEHGDFSSRLEKRSNDEIGDIAEQTNQLMTTLEQGIGSISTEIEALSGQGASSSGGDQLRHASDVVHNMVMAARFKQTIENDRDLDEVYGRLGRSLREQFGLQRFSLYEVSNSRNRLKLIHAGGLPEGCNLWCDAEILLDGEACRCKRTAQKVSSVEEDGICPSYVGNSVQQEEKLMHVCMPIILSGQVGSVLQIMFRQQEAAEIQEKLPRLKNYLDEAAPVIEAKRLMQSLRESAMRDAMTGMYNRRFLEEYVDMLTASALRRKASIGVLMCDVDFFKQVNDTLGHDIGDSMLKAVADLIRQSIRASDLAIRYGGEEFLALLVEASEEKSLEVAERIRAGMEEFTFNTTSGPLKKTLSVGVAMYPDDSEAFWECVKYADVAMYKAKDGGRNKVLRFEESMWDQKGMY